MKTSTQAVHVSLANALSQGPPPAGNLAVPIFSRGSLVVELYTPVGHDPQKPHMRDEVYFVTRGKGWFFDGEQRYTVEAGSFLFVPAGRPHRFEDFSSDFTVWVVFYGPEGAKPRADWRGGDFSPVIQPVSRSGVAACGIRVESRRDAPERDHSRHQGLRVGWGAGEAVKNRCRAAKARPPRPKASRVMVDGSGTGAGETRS